MAEQPPDRRLLDSGIEVKPLYRAADAPATEREPPGAFPFTRGPYPDMYRGRPWTMRQYAGFASAEESNERYRYLLARGQTGLSVAFDLPTQLGYDSDDAMAEGEVGRTGVAIDSIADMEVLLDGIPLGEVSTSMTINAPAALLLLLYELVAEQQGVPGTALRGTVQNDILKEYVARGNYIFPPRPSMRLTTDLFAYCEERIPRWNTISISGYHIREAGSTAAQELAFTLANGIAYCEAAVAAGLSPDAFGARLSFFFNAHNDFFQEVAKFRAARTLWAQIMRDRFGATTTKAQALRFHAQTGGSTLTAQQPENNIVRVAVQALSAVCGGAQSTPHEQLRRGARAAERARGDDRAAHPADPDARGRHDRHGRSARRLLLHRGAHRGSRAACDRADRARRRARRRGCRDRGRLRPGRDRGVRLPLPGRRRVGPQGRRRRQRVQPGSPTRASSSTASTRPASSASATASRACAPSATPRTPRARSPSSARPPPAPATSCRPSAKPSARAARSARSAARSASSGEPTTAGELGDSNNDGRGERAAGDEPVAARLAATAARPGGAHLGWLPDRPAARRAPGRATPRQGRRARPERPLSRTRSTSR